MCVQLALAVNRHTRLLLCIVLATRPETRAKCYISAFLMSKCVHAVEHRENRITLRRLLWRTDYDLLPNIGI